MAWNIDSVIFIGFLVINLAVGLFYGRGVKNIKDYALGGRNFTTAALVSTIVATWASGSGFFITMSKTYSDGLYYVFASSLDLEKNWSKSILAIILTPCPLTA